MNSERNADTSDALISWGLILRTILSTAVLALLAVPAASGVMAADLIVDEPAAIAATPVLSGVYVEVYGGGHFPGTSTYFDIHDEYSMLAGPTLGVSAGILTPVPGLSAGLDVMWTSSEYDYLGEYLHTLSLMAELEYALPVGDAFEVYAAAGLGVVNITFEDGPGDTWSGSGAGYQVAVGARVEVVENVSLFAEYKHQDTFGYVDVEGDDVSWPTDNVLVGLRFAF